MYPYTGIKSYGSSRSRKIRPSFLAGACFATKAGYPTETLPKISSFSFKPSRPKISLTAGTSVSQWD